MTSNELTIHEGQSEFTPAQVAVFLHHAQRTGLDHTRQEGPTA